MKMPASFAEFSDALQKARIKDGSFCKNELTCIHYNGLTHAMIGWNANLYDLNLFAQRLASLTEEQKKGMDALLKIKQNHRVAPIPLNQLINLTYNTDICCFAPRVSNHEELGAFLYANEMLSNEAMALLDTTEEGSGFQERLLELLGEQHQEDHGGVFTDFGYMDEVGRYPLHISDYDKTVLAIRDGEFDAFKNLYPRVSDQTDDLLIEVAGRPGVVGGNMTLILLAAVERFSPEAYLTACKRAVETGDSWRVQTLVKESEGRLSEPLPSLHGEVILYAYTNNCRNIAKDLIAQCTPEQIASVPPKLLRWVAEKLDFQTAVDLVDKGVRPGDEVAGILRTLTGQHQEWMAERLLEHGMPVEPDNYDALYACVSNQAVGAAKLLLDRGIDLEQYQLWAEHRPKGDGYTETMEELAAYWSELQNSTQPEDSPMKGMNL